MVLTAFLNTLVSSSSSKFDEDEDELELDDERDLDLPIEGSTTSIEDASDLWLS